ncbi:MAG: Ig-like domain-containing protein [Desulfobacteraceae bacterium]|nr:Ig-like domain-containing protein [Desulfobacteraceae bacterium]
MMAILTPESLLEKGSSYNVTITSDVTDAEENLLQEDTWSFTTSSAPDNAPPKVIDTFPADGVTNISINIEELTVIFSKPMKSSTIINSNFIMNDGTADIPVRVAFGGFGNDRIADIKLDQNLKYLIIYFVPF